MGFFADQEGPGLRVPTGVDPTREPPRTVDVIASAFRQDNPLVSLAGRLFDETHPADPDHNPLDIIRDTPFEQRHLNRFIDSRSEAETRQIMARIEREEEDRRILDAAGGAGVVAQIAAGMLDPTIALPGGAIVKSAKGGYSAVKSAALVGTAAGVQTAVAEGVLQATQETRTAAESIGAIGSATLLGAFIGAGAAALLSRAEREVLEKSLDDMRADIDAHANNDNVPFARAAGAAATDERKLQLKKTGLEATAILSPTRRVLSAESIAARRAMADLAETPYRFEGDETPTNGPALSRIAQMEINGARVEVGDEMVRLFAEYRYGNPDQTFPVLKSQFEHLTGRNEGRLTYAEFKREISRALMEGDQHSIPQVAQAAQFIRKRVFEPWKERAIAAGLLPEGVSVKTAESYFQRVYNKEMINARRPEFVDRVTQWLKADQDTKRQAKERLTFLSAQLKSWNDQVRKLEARFGRIEDKIERLEARTSERGMEADATEARAETVEQRQGRIADEAADLDDAIRMMEEDFARNHPSIAPILRRTEAMLEAQSRQHDVAGAVADEARRGERRNFRRLEALKERLANAEERRALIEEYRAAAEEIRSQVRAKIEEEIAAWEGKSAAEAKSALRAREKYAKETARAEDAPRLESADDAVDRAVKRIIESDRDLDDEALRGRAQQITDRILGSPDGRLPYDIPMGGPEVGWRGPGADDVRGPLQAREFNIPDAMIRDFLEDDVEQVVAMHLRTIVPDVLLTERFGDVRMTEPLMKITEEYAAKIDAAKSEKARKALAAERDAVIRDIAAVRDRVRGVYGWSPDLRNMARVAAGAKAVNNLTSMGVSAISSLPDMAGIVLRHGMSTVFQNGWAPYFRWLTGKAPEFEKFKSQMRAVGIGIETTINARQHAIDDVMDVYRPQSRFERALQGASDKFFVANLLAPLTDFQKTVSAHVSVSEMLKAAKAVANGKATQKQIANLAESGIDRQMAARIWQQFERGGEVIDGVHLPNTKDWTDQAAAQALNGAVAREVDIAVVTPGQEKPLWLSNPVLSLLGQFKSFTASATERILIANLQRRDANVLSGIIFTVGLGMLSYKLNSLFGGQETSDRPQDWVKEGISRSGLLGWFEEGNAFASKMSRGGVDIYRMIGADRPMSRYASRSTLDMLLGPTAGKIGSLTQITGAAGALEWTESDTKAVRRLIAAQNLFYIRGLLNQVEEGVNGAFGIETRAQ